MHQAIIETTGNLAPKSIGKVISHACKLIDRAHAKHGKKDRAVHRATRYLKKLELSRRNIDVAYDALFDYADTVYEYANA